MQWTAHGDVFEVPGDDALDSRRAWEPSVLEDVDGTLRMWYSGHDGTTGRILQAVRPPGGTRARTGLAVDAGVSGDTDRYGVQSPCVFKVVGGYLMAYVGFDGEESLIHMAASRDGDGWSPLGPIMPAPGEGLEGRTPCLIPYRNSWWVFYAGPGGILAAVSGPDGSGAWDRLGVVLAPGAGETDMSHPSVVEIRQTLYMFYSAGSPESRISMAMSADGIEWSPRGSVMTVPDHDPDALALESPCALRLNDGALGLWYARRPPGDEALAYSICSATLPGPWPGGA